MNSTNILDLPREVLIFILRNYYEGVTVRVYPPTYKQPPVQTPVALFLVNKVFHDLSLELMPEYVTFDFRTLSTVSRATWYGVIPKRFPRWARFVIESLWLAPRFLYYRIEHMKTFLELRQITVIENVSLHGINRMSEVHPIFNYAMLTVCGPLSNASHLQNHRNFSVWH